VEPNANSLSDDEFREIGLRYADGIDVALQRWLQMQLCMRLEAAGLATDKSYAAAEQVAAEVSLDVASQVRELAALDIDAQATTPLAIVRTSLQAATDLLAELSVPRSQRDVDDIARFPADHYALTPASFADIDLELASLAVEWGAAKAWLHKQRHGGG
jgi:hypothetical protein